MILKRARNNAVGPQVREKTAGDAAGRKSVIHRLTYALLSGVSGIAVATQWFASSFDYDPALGINIGQFYAPWKIFEWAAAYYAQYPQAVMQAGSIGMVTTVVMMFLQMGVILMRSQSSTPNEFLHGSARWADPEDITRAGLRSEAPDSVYVGAVLDKNGDVQYLRHSGPEHVLCYAPTRSGKGVGLVLPTLLSWPQSAVVCDLKGELWALTSGWRQQHAKNRVLRFEPALRNGGVSWNPLEEIRKEVDEDGNAEFNIGDIQNISMLICDPDGKGLANHWEETAFSLLNGVILHAKYLEHHTGETATLPGIDRLLSDPRRPVQELWQEMTTYKHSHGQPCDAVVQAARDMLDRPEDEAGSVLSSTKKRFALYRDPVVAGNVGRCDFHIKDLMNHGDPVTLYIVTQPNDKARLRPLVRILVNMIVRLLADKMDFENGRPKVTYKHRLLMMLDEFTSLGKLDILQESLAFVAGYGIKCFIIIQDLGQIQARDMYGHDESITSNCHVQTAFPPNKLHTAKYLSDMTGQTTIVKSQVTMSGKRGSMLNNVSTSFHETQRPLLTPDEAMRMPGPKKDAAGLIVEPGDMVVYVAGFPAIYGRQPLYFQDPVFSARAAVPAPTKSDRTVELPAPAPADERVTI